MEMDSSRRSVARPPGPKKPRLAEDDRASNGLAADRDRPFPASRASGGGRPTDPRIRAAEREREREGEREDPERGGSYRQQQQQQQLQELVAQYKTALVELTFNSKPIITNLTIIAGENIHAAKAIAATICANVLEVPSDQKLPSLYLLDSIVKNIGRDYIKYFSARLPEVFCKAYKQVDSSVHPGMRHLFGTWKGVFPLAPLEIIEKELAFPPIVSGSSGSTAPKPDSQIRPSHSIHVNPKYLEARQRLQQSTRAKEARNDNLDSALSAVASERSERLASDGSSKQWTDLPMKLPNIQRPQREHPGDPVRERKIYRDLEFSSDLPLGRVGDRIKERDGPGKPLYGASNATSELSVTKRGGFDVNHVYGHYHESGLTRANHQMPSVHLINANNSSQPLSKNWQNSEEEEYLWDDMNSGSTEYGGTSSTINGGWNTDDADKHANFGRGKQLPMENEHQDSLWNKPDTHTGPQNSRREERVPFLEDLEEHLPQPRQQDNISRNMDTSADSLSVQRAESGHYPSSLWPPCESPSSVVSLNRANLTMLGRSEGQSIASGGALSTSMSRALPATALLSHSIPSSLGPSTGIASGSRGMFGQQIQPPFRPPSPSSHLPPPATLLHSKSHTSTDHDHLQSYSLRSQKPLQPPAQLNQPPHASVNQDLFTTFAHSQSQQSHSILNSKPSQDVESSSASSTSFNQLRHQLPFLQQPQPDLLLRQPQSECQPSVQTQKPPLLPPSMRSHQSGGFSGISHLNNVAADVSGQSNTSDLVSTVMKSGVALNNPSINQNICPPLPSGPPPIHFLPSSAPLVTPSSATVSTSNSSAPSVALLPVTSVLPPLPPGPPPPSSILVTTSQLPSTSSAIPNPLSSLLSSLVAKGLITPSTELPSTASAQMLARPSNQNSGFASSTEVQIPSASAAMTISPSSPVKDLSVPDSSVPVSVALTEVTSICMKDLLGIDFRPDIVREFHPLVINSLIDDIKYQCKTCGLRFKLQQQLQSHLDWHASKSSKEDGFGRVSRKWFADADNWVARSVGAPYDPLSATHIEVMIPSGEKCEAVVPADESQCICALCGEPFEDFYSLERDEWMYKGTMYLKLPDRQDKIESMDEGESLVPIVHAKCLSRSSGDMEESEKS